MAELMNGMMNDMNGMNSFIHLLIHSFTHSLR